MKEKLVFWLAVTIFVISSICVYFICEALNSDEPVIVSPIAETSIQTIVETEAATSAEYVMSEAPDISVLININTATANELMTLDGIGEVIAQRIVDYRTENGDFQSIEELMDVSGIGEKKFEAIKAFVTI